MEQQLNIAKEKFPELAARLSGFSKATTIVLIHGFPAEGNVWRAVVPELAAHTRVLVPDLPGVGGSRFAGEAVSIEELADGIAALLKSAGISKAIIAGHSMGGYIALAFAERFPDMVEGLSLIHSGAKADDDEKVNARRKSIELIQKGGREAFINAMLPPLFADAFGAAHPAIVEAQRAQALAVSPLTLTAFYHAMINRPDRQDVLRSAAFPVQWIIGGQDPLLPPQKVMQQTTLANVNFVTVYQQSGHMAMLEEPRRLAADIGQFAAYCAARQTEELSA